MDDNLWKNLNIPPLDFCSLGRAQKLLNCDLSDFITWWQAGKIDLFYNFDALTAVGNLIYVTSNETEDSSVFKTSTMASFEKSEIEPIGIEAYEKTRETFNTKTFQSHDAILGGFWKLNVCDYLSGKATYPIRKYSVIEPYRMQKDLGYNDVYVILNDILSTDHPDGIEIDIADLVMCQADIERIYHASKVGIFYNEKDKSSSTNISNPSFQKSNYYSQQSESLIRMLLYLVPELRPISHKGGKAILSGLVALLHNELDKTPSDINLQNFLKQISRIDKNTIKSAIERVDLNFVNRHLF